MAAPPPEKGKKLADFLRRNTAVPTQSFFRAMNFELYARCARREPRVHCRSRLTPPPRSGNSAVAVPGTLIFVGVLAYFAMLKSDQHAAEQERLAAEASAARRREHLDG
jgi:hypothetical protein